MHLSKSHFLSLKPCEEAIDFCEVYGYDFPKLYEICHRADWMVWLLRRLELLPKPVAIQLQITYLEHMLPLWKRVLPDNTLIVGVLALARTWLSDSNNVDYTKICEMAGDCRKLASLSINKSLRNFKLARACEVLCHSLQPQGEEWFYREEAVYHLETANFDYEQQETCDDRARWLAAKLRKLVPNPFTPAE